MGGGLRNVCAYYIRGRRNMRVFRLSLARDVRGGDGGGGRVARAYPPPRGDLPIRSADFIDPKSPAPSTAELATPYPPVDGDTRRPSKPNVTTCASRDCSE